VTQYIYKPGVIDRFLPARSAGTLPANAKVKSFDAAATAFQSVIAIGYELNSQHDIAILRNGAGIQDESTLLPGVPNVSFSEYVSGAWLALETISAEDTQKPAIGIQTISQRGFVPGEIELEFDVGVVWEIATSRENQIDGEVIQVRLEAPRVTVLPVIPEYNSDSSARALDVLEVINWLNSRANRNGEGEGPSEAMPARSSDILNAMAADAAMKYLGNIDNEVTEQGRSLRRSRHQR
jgi:hypothetical protein